MAVYSFPPPCRTIVWSEADQNGNPLALRESGTTTLTFAEVWPTFDPDELGGLNFGANEGEYDFCVSDLKFLDEDGEGGRAMTRRKSTPTLKRELTS